MLLKTYLKLDGSSNTKNKSRASRRKSIKKNSKRKSVRKSRRKSVRKSRRKSVKKSRRKSLKKSRRKSVKKSRRKSVRKSRRKSVRKSKRKTVKKSKRKTVKKSKRKTRKKSVRKSKRKPSKRTIRKPPKRTGRKPSKNKPKSYKIKVKETLDDGNCFFSSIYRSLLDKKLLAKVYICIPEIRSNSENEFIRKIRYLTAENIDQNIRDMFNYYISSNFDVYTFIQLTEYLGSITVVLRKFYEEGKFQPQYEDVFINEIKDTIRKDKNWVGQLEVEYIIHIFQNRCNIKIKTYNTKINAFNSVKNDLINNSYLNSIYLLNLNETHWVYLII
jgi:hypothetical protein